MRCVRHGEDFRLPFQCKACETDPATSPESDLSHEAPFIEGLLTAIEHERLFNERAAEAWQWAQESETETGRNGAGALAARFARMGYEAAKNREGDDLIRRNAKALKELRGAGWPMGVTIGAPRKDADADEGNGN